MGRLSFLPTYSYWSMAGDCLLRFGRVFFLPTVTGLWLGIVCCWSLVEFSSYIQLLVYGWGLFVVEVWSSFLPTCWSMAGDCLLLRFGRVFFLHVGLWLGIVCCWGLVKFSSYMLVYGWGLFAVEVWSSFLPTCWSMAGDCLLLRFGRVFFLRTLLLRFFCQLFPAHLHSLLLVGFQK